MIVVTGAAGFIGSCMVSKLNENRFYDLVLVDDFSRAEKESNYVTKRFKSMVDRNDFFEWLDGNGKHVQFIFHLGARTDTAETDTVLFDRLNLDYSKQVWNACIEKAIPLIYASSAATYGDGGLGYADDHLLCRDLVPLNPYGRSKNDFDVWALEQTKKPLYWAGLKFFNVYGPNEYHKGRMASVIFHTFNQINESGSMKLFQSHRADIANGEQKRDFVYVKDVVDVMYFLMHYRQDSGIYNLGSGTARSFNDLAYATFDAMGMARKIEYIPTPEDIRDTYQYFTEAEMGKLKSIGYSKEFHSLESGVQDYVSGYLLNDKQVL